MAKTTRKDRADATPDGSDAKAAEKWLSLVEDGRKREKGYRKLAQELIRIYEEAEEDEIPFNILYANTETLAPALYNSDPRPDTRPRAKVENATVSAAAGLVDAYLAHFIDTGDARFPSFGSVVSDSLIQSLVPGRGLIRFHYEAEVASGEDGEPLELIDETVWPESLDYDRVIFGYAKSWEDTPWIAFEHCFTFEEAEEKFGKEIAERLSYTKPESDEGSKPADSEGVEVAVCYEIWCKRKKAIYWVEKNAAKVGFLKPPLPDPYKLAGFYPMPKPLTFFHRVKGQIPVPLYKLYKQQAAELNRITRRISKLIEAMKIRGFYDSQVQGIEKIFESEENTLIAITNLAALGQGARAENAVWLVPLEEHAQVLQQLLQNRQEILQVIYQVMGIADIMRGSTRASETLGAQELKNRWGTLRLKRAQKLVAEFVRDGLRIAAELAFSRMSPKNLRLLTGSPLLPEEEMVKLEAQAQQAQATGAQVPPELAQQLVLPSFDDALSVLRSDLLRRYAIDIETNSTIDAEASEDKENMSEFLNALSQFLNGLFPLVQAGVLPAEVVKGVLMAMSRRFRMGPDLDQYLQKIGQGGGQNLQAQQAQLEQQGQELQKAQQALAGEQEKVKKDRMALEKSRMDFEVKQMQGEVAQIKAQLGTQIKDAKAKAQLESLLLKIQAATERLSLAQQRPEREESPDADV